jgi:hypothetical protein
MLLLRKLVLPRHFISLFLSTGYRNGIGSHVLRNTFRLASTTIARVVHSGAQIVALFFSAQTHRLCFASNTDLIVPKAKPLCPLAPGVRKRLFPLPLPTPKKSKRACGRCGTAAPQRPHALASSGWACCQAERRLRSPAESSSFPVLALGQPGKAGWCCLTCYFKLTL